MLHIAHRLSLVRPRREMVRPNNLQLLWGVPCHLLRSFPLAIARAENLPRRSTAFLQ